jgi:hypothetical protein
MPRGGLRPGAGRPPKGAEPKKVKQAAKAAPEGALDPLAYMLSVMNDSAADDARRDRMAIAAAVYVHGKPSDESKGVKKTKQEAGERVATSSGKFAAPAPPLRLVQ